MACLYLYEGNWYTEDQIRGIYDQLNGRGDKTLPSAASPSTMKKIKEFLDRIGVQVQSLANITYNGQSLGVNGLADPLNGLIKVVEGKEDIALPEEAMHMAVELIEQTNPVLFKEMMDRIGRYRLFDRVMAEYQNNPFYQTKEGRPDVRKIKKEAIGKVLAQTVINKNENANEKPELLSQTRTWWERIVAFIKGIFLRAQFNPFEDAATQVLENRLEGDFNSVDGVFASRSPNAVNASLKLVAALRDARATRWFNDMFQKGNKPQFLQKIQQDLQAPKAQVEMLKKLIQGREYDNIGQLITDVMTELSYTVEVNVREQGGRTSAEEIAELRALGMTQAEMDEAIGTEPTQHYSSLTVPGGVNYRENEIKTPDITPSIKGHAAFASDKGIGWFRSDDKAINSTEVDVPIQNDEEGIPVFNSSTSLRTITGTPTKTRRILEIQSDLFQKGRTLENLVQEQAAYENAKFSYEGHDYSTRRDSEFEQYEPGETRITYSNFYKDGQPISAREFNLAFAKAWGLEDEYREDYSNDFLQLLNKENNWVTFFVKAIIQDSTKKGYENVRFPGGNTAAKIEGHETLESYIAERERMVKEAKEGIKLIEDELDTIKETGRFNAQDAAYYIKGDKYYQSLYHETSDKSQEISKDFYDQNYQNYTLFIAQSIEQNERGIQQFEKEIEEAREGRAKFSSISGFYENTVHNILKKQGYNPKEVTDEYGNKWFEIKIEEQRDLSDFYFQISGQDLATKIVDKNANISKRGDEFEINGNKIRNSIQKEVQDFYRKRIGAANADKALRGFKQETENKVQVDIQDILTRFIDDDNKVRTVPLAQTNPSAVDPNNNSFYLTLEAHLQERLNTYEPGTKFVHSINLYDSINTAGRADLIAITPEGKIDILQFKVPQLSKVGTDIPVYRQEAYNVEIEGLRKILQAGYGVSRSDFRQTRAIPIKAEYERIALGMNDMQLSKLTVGSVNIALIQDDSLLPISSDSELTENERFDEFIKRLKGLAQRLSSERVPPEQRIERANRVAQLVAAIRKLQVKRDGSGVLASAKTIIKRAKETSKNLKEKIANTDPNVATIEELNKIAEEILSDKDQVEIYKDLYNVFKNVFTDGTVDSEDIVKEARTISDDANDIIDTYWDTAVHFRIKKFAAKVGIKDEFNPEKKLTWYRRMIRSLSQSSIKAGAELWQLVKNINNGFKLEFLDRIDELQKIEAGVSEWMKGKSVQDLYKKIFQYDAKGRWNGKVIQKFSKSFYEELKRAQENKDERWVRDNIDQTAYLAWYTAEHARRIQDSRTARYSADDAENARLVQQKLQDFVDTFDIRFKKGIGTYNWSLKNFPKEDNWKSAEYQELEKTPELFKLYEYYRKRLEESWKLGMLHEHNGWSWFPNVRRNLLEKLSTAPAGDKLKSLFGNIRIEAEDQTFGKIDPITGKPVDEIHANFVSDLGTWVQDVDESYFLDYGEKSMDIFKVLALWDAEILKYRLRTESEGIARLIYYTESDARRRAYESTATGKLKREAGTNKPITISNEVNATYIKEHIDAVYYGKNRSDEFDVVVNVPYKAAVEKINKLFGHDILTVPQEENVRISGIKVIEVMNRYFVTKTLGLNAMTSVAQLFGGSINTFINQGIYFNKKDMLEAEIKYVSGKFYNNDEDKKLAGLVSFLHPYTEDRTNAAIRKLSVSKMVEYLSSDHLFYLQRGSDNWVNTVVALAMIKNTMVSDGKLVNIRDFVRKELGHANKYSGTYEESKDFDRRLEIRVAEIQKSPEALINYAQVVNDQISLPNIDRNGEEVINLRQQILELIKDALGNTSSEDLSLYKRSITWQSFFMFKNWIPRMLDVRMGSLKYSPGTDSYEYGRVRMLVNGVKHMGLTSITSLTKLLGNNSEPLIEVAKKEYARKRQDFSQEQQDLDMTEAEFVDMYVKGVRSEVKELLLAASLMGLLIAMRLSAPDQDEDPETKGAYRWALRGLDKLTDELTFMYTPTSFTSILNGSVFPAVGILVEFQRFFTSVIEKLFFNMIGDEEKAATKHPSKYLFRMLPITKEVIQYLALFNADIAKEYGIRVNTNYGSVR